MKRRGEVYTLTYDDANLPSHYRWKWESRLYELEPRYKAVNESLSKSTKPQSLQAPASPDPRDVRRILNELDAQGRWVSTYDGKRLVGQAKMQVGTKYLSSELFSRNIIALSRFVAEHSR